MNNYFDLLEDVQNVYRIYPNDKLDFEVNHQMTNNQFHDDNGDLVKEDYIHNHIDINMDQHLLKMKIHFLLYHNIEDYYHRE
jgi:hypothetical protein